MNWETITFTVSLPPITKKNHQQIVTNKATGRPFIVQSKKYKQYEQDAMWFIPKISEPINEPVNVKCLFYMPTKRRVDKSNLENAMHDILVRAGILEDDNRDIIASTDGSRVFYDKENPRTEVTITMVKDYEQWRKK